MTIESWLGVCRRLALKAGDAVMAIYEADDFSIDHKADDSPVTAADLAADRIICEGLSAAFPEIVVITEEQASAHSATAPNKFFIIDPLDGTKEFIKRRGEFTINIALIEDGAPKFGVVFAPALGRLFYTVEGGAVEEVGPFDPDVIGQQMPLSVSDACTDQLVVVASKSHRDAVTDDYIARYSVGDFKSAGSSLKFCLVAAGEADLYPRLGRTMEWDTAAGDAILRAAGGKTVCLEKREPFQYGKPGYENGFFVASAPAIAVKSAS